MPLCLTIIVLWEGGEIMSKNTGRGYRQGSVRGRTQLPTPKGFIKRMVSTGQFMDFSENPFKGVAKEKDGRRG